MAKIQVHTLVNTGKPVRWVLATDHEQAVRELVQALTKIRGGVALMVPEPQKSGFFEIIDAALAKYKAD